MKKLSKILSLYIIFALLLSSLSGCSKAPSSATTGTGSKQEFIAKVAPVASFSMKGGFEKQGIVSATEEVTISSQVAGRVTAILGKIGRKVGVGQLLLSLDDTNGTISFSAKKAAVGLDSARDNYNQSKLGLEKSLFDTSIVSLRNQVTSATTKEDILKQQEKINKDLRDNDLSNSSSNLSLQLQKLGNDLSKAELDYQTKLDADNQTILNFFNSVKLIGSDLSNLFQDSLNLSDQLLGVTTANRGANDSFEYVLGNKDMTSKQNADSKMTDALYSYDNFKILVSDVNINTMSGLLISYSKGVDSINAMLSAINTLLINTEPGGPFTPVMYNTYKTQFDGYKSKASGLGTSITSQLNGINSFFATYKQTQESLAKGVDSLKQQIELSKRGLSDTQFNVNLGSERQILGLDANLKNQELTDKSTQYLTDFAVKNNSLALQAIGNAVENAQIIFEETNFARGKFTIESPIPGTITDVYVDMGQEVNPGAPLFTVVNTNLKQIEINVTEGERELIIPGQSVIVRQGGAVGKGIVESVSEVADRNFSYKVIIVINEGNFTIGSSVSVVFSGSVGENIIIPLNVVTIVDNGRGVVSLRKNGKLETIPVGLGALAGQYVIVSEGLSIDDLIITSDISNFDQEKMEMRVKGS